MFSKIASAGWRSMAVAVPVAGGYFAARESGFVAPSVSEGRFYNFEGLRGLSSSSLSLCEAIDPHKFGSKEDAGESGRAGRGSRLPSPFLTLPSFATPRREL